VTARHRLSTVLGSLLIVPLCASTGVRAQSGADVRTMENARAIYFTGPIPGSIACNAAVDWDKFVARSRNEPDQPAHPRLEKLKLVRISFAARDGQAAEVKVEQPDSSAASISDGLSQQLQAFFQIYWAEAYGRLFFRRGEAFELVTTRDGYEERSSDGETSVSVAMNKAFLVTHLSLHSPGTASDVTPGFKAGADGLLRLRHLEQALDLGYSRVVVLDVDLDYQKVGDYEVPQHITVSVPGSFAFDYTFSGCEVTAPGVAPAPAGKE
jgi:hypothetical protein